MPEPRDRDLHSIQEVRDLVARAKAAQATFQEFSQAQVDRVVEAMARAGFDAAEDLARLAVEESGFGRVDSKTIKNQFSTRDVWESIKDLPTAGIVRRDDARRVYEIAEPFGVIAGIVPITNPTSTALFKCLIALKARNAIVVSPHPRGVRCTKATTDVLDRAARAAGAPEGLLGTLETVTLEGTQALMKHPGVDLILATGGQGLVEAAYSAGKPAIGVGPGNVPAFIERTADVRLAVAMIVASQTFDWATICSSEQSVILDAAVRDAALEEFRRQGAHVCSPEETEAVRRTVMLRRGMNPATVGLPPAVIAERAGFPVPPETTLLLCPQDGVGWEYPLSLEKLCPVLALYVEDGWEAACERCIEILSFGGMGHSLAIHTQDSHVIEQFAMRKPAHRILVNAPTSQGGVGFATHLVPSMTLGCGAFGGNISSDNITAYHLMNLKRVAYVRDDFLRGLAAAGGAGAGGAGAGGMAVGGVGPGAATGGSAAASAPAGGAAPAGNVPGSPGPAVPAWSFPAGGVPRVPPPVPREASPAGWSGNPAFGRGEGGG